MMLRPVNPADISLIQGRMGRPPLPLTPGAEGLGIVDRCGPQVNNFEPGQRVVCVPSTAWSALDGSGTWQQVRLLVPLRVPECTAHTRRHCSRDIITIAGCNKQGTRMCT